jgi:lysophospholipase L1-like esterase
MDDRGHIPKGWKVRGQKERRRMRDEVLKDYEISERGTRSITRIVRTLEKRSVSVVLVSMPVPQRYSEVHPHGNKDFEAAQRHLIDLAARLNIPLIDMSTAMKDRMFVDFTHLGEQGAQRFSRKLKGELHDLGY